MRKRPLDGFPIRDISPYFHELLASSRGRW